MSSSDITIRWTITWGKQKVGNQGKTTQEIQDAET
jgi:hypothetical protein